MRGRLVKVVAFSGNAKRNNYIYQNLNQLKGLGLGQLDDSSTRRAAYDGHRFNSIQFILNGLKCSEIAREKIISGYLREFKKLSMYHMQVLRITDVTYLTHYTTLK